MTFPMSPIVLRILATVLAPMQWGIAYCYLRYWDALSKYSTRRLLAWLVVFLLNVVIPIGIYRLNAQSENPDTMVDAVVLIDAVVCISLLFFVLKKRSLAQAHKKPPSD